MSSIYIGAHGKDASQRYGLNVKVSAWDKPFTVTSVSKNKKVREVLTVSLYRMKNQREMTAIFSDTVAESGRVKLKFAGQTILYRPN